MRAIITAVALALLAAGANAQSDKGAVQIAPANQLSVDFLIGSWGDNGDCKAPVVLNGDGTFVMAATGGQGQWQLNENRLIMAGQGGIFELRVAIIDQSTLQITNPDNSVGVSQRC